MTEPRRVPDWIFTTLALVVLALAFVSAWIALNPVQFMLLATPFVLPAIIVGGLKLTAWLERRRGAPGKETT